MFDKFHSKVGVAYKIIEDNETGDYLLVLYKIKLDNGQYVFIKYKEVQSFSFAPLYSLIDKVEAKPIEYYLGHDFGRQLKKTKN